MGALKILAAKAAKWSMSPTPAKTRSVFMDIYALLTIAHMKAHGTTREQLAGVTAKNAFHGSMNRARNFSRPCRSKRCWRPGKSSTHRRCPCAPHRRRRRSAGGRERAQGPATRTQPQGAGACLGPGVRLRRDGGRPVGGRIRRQQGLRIRRCRARATSAW